MDHQLRETGIDQTGGNLFSSNGNGSSYETMPDTGQLAEQPVRGSNLSLHFNTIAGRSYRAVNTDQLFDILRREFKSLDLDFMVMLVDQATDEVFFKYNSVNPFSLNLSQTITGRKIHTRGKRARDYSQDLVEVFQNGKTIFYQEYLETVASYIPVSRSLAIRALKVIGLSESTCGVALPLKTGDRITGCLFIWGDELYKEDIPTCRFFAGQISSMVERNQLQSNQLEKSRRLQHTNQLMEALNAVSARITSTNDPDQVFPILGSELKSLGYRCMVTLLEEDQDTGYFHFTTEQKTIELIEKFLGIKVIGRRFVRSEMKKPLWIFESSQDSYVNDFFSHLSGLFSRVPGSVKESALALVGISKNTNALFLPLISHNRPLGSLVIWSADLEPDELQVFSVFADQIANMLEKYRLARSEKENAEALAHSYQLLHTLNNLAARLTSALRPDLIFRILEEEFSQLGFQCMVTELNPEGDESQFRFTTIEPKLLKTIKRLTGLDLIGKRFPRESWNDQLQEVYLNKKSVQLDDFREYLFNLFPRVPKPLGLQACRILGIKEHTAAAYVPMIYNQKVIGSIAIWGEQVYKEDLPAYFIFASQLANALENARMVDAIQESAVDLEKVNELLETLSIVASKITSVKDPDRIFPILGHELALRDYHCAVILINPEYTEATIQYLNIESPRLDFIQNKLRVKVIGRKFTTRNMPDAFVELYGQNQNFYIEDLSSHLTKLLQPLPKPILHNVIKNLNIQAQTSAVFTPMIYQDQVLGSIMVWGESIQAQDLTAFSIFSAQVANALQNANLITRNRQEIQARKQVQQDLEVSRRELQGIFEHAHDAILIIDKKGNILTANDRACDIYQIPKNKLLRKKITALFRREQNAKKLINSTLEKGYCNKCTGEYTLPDGTILAFEVNSSLVEFDGDLAIQCINRDVTAQKKYENQLRHAAMHDSLTGLPNRILFNQHLDHSIARHSRYPQNRFALFYLDLDNFKRINDSLGHSVGDQFLIKIGERLQDVIRSSDIAARIGGDEFVILMEEVHNLESINAFCSRFQREISSPLSVQGHEIVVSGSVGVVQSSVEITSAEEYLRRADIAMYQAKNTGKNQFCIFQNSMQTSDKLKLSLEHEIRHGLTEEQFHLYYQPINILLDNSICSYEALVRWQHPERGLISPGIFIPVAEQSGLIHDLGSWILMEACSTFQSWRDRDRIPDSTTISVNISPLQLMHAGFSAMVHDCLEKSQLPARNLNLEVTESALIANPSDAKQKLQAVRELGVNIHLDDFGTGFSSLSFLTTFPIDAIKIDRQFIFNLHEEKNAALVRSMLLLANSLQINLIAEGVETIEQLELLQRMECKQAQGYYFSHPLSREKIRTLQLNQSLALS